MMMMGLHFIEAIPFRDVYIHALVRDEGGEDVEVEGQRHRPARLINRFGADALRFTLAAMAAQGRDIKLSESRIEGYRNFATKLWNAARFAEMNGCVRTQGFDPANVREPLNRSILGEAASAAAETAGAIESYRFNDAANGAYRFVWSVFCDWHLELAKPVLQGAATPPPRPRPGPRSRTCSIRSTRCCIPSCRSSPRSCGRSQAKPGPSARVRWRWDPGLAMASRSTRRSKPRSAGLSTSSPRSGR